MAAARVNVVPYGMEMLLFEKMERPANGNATMVVDITSKWVHDQFSPFLNEVTEHNSRDGGQSDIRGGMLRAPENHSISKEDDEKQKYFVMSDDECKLCTGQADVGLTVSRKSECP